MHAPRREPFWPDEPDVPRAVDIAKRIALVRRYALILSGAGGDHRDKCNVGHPRFDPVALWRDVPTVRLEALGLAAWLVGGIGWLLMEAVGLWVRRDVTKGTRG